MKSKQETIKMVTDSVSSIFTKDDVLTLLNNLETGKGSSLSLDTVEKIADKITRVVEYDLTSYIELSSVTISYGSYGTGIDDQKYELDSYNLRDTIVNAIQEHVEVCDEENNSTDNQQVSN